MSKSIEIDDVLALKRAPLKRVPHTVRLTVDLKIRVDQAVSVFGNARTAEIIRRGIEAAIEQALASEC